MNANQITVVVFAFIVIAMSAYAVITVVRSPHFRRKPLWIIGSLFGFVGFGINWASPDDLNLLIGVSIPVVMIFKILPAGPVIVKAHFPLVAAAVLLKKYRHSS